MPQKPQSERQGSRCRECLEIYGPGPAGVILGVYGIRAPHETPVGEMNEGTAPDHALFR